MAVKRLDIENIGWVTFQKRRGTRSIRIRISGHEVHVSLPPWVPYKTAMLFVQAKQEWISQNKNEAPQYEDGKAIGRHHHLRLFQDPSHTTVRTRVADGQIRVYFWQHTPEVQKAIERACKRALRSEAEAYLPQRLSQLADITGHQYRSVQCKFLRGRWGSCDQASNVVLNIYLMQLPPELSDYVMIHELTHTQHHNHSKDFWQRMAQDMPTYKLLRSRLKEYHPHILLK